MNPLLVASKQFINSVAIRRISNAREERGNKRNERV